MNSIKLIKTDWRYYRKLLLLSIVLVPLFGAGFILLVYIYFKIEYQSYEVTDEGVRHRNIFLPYHCINSVKVSDFRVLKNGNIATLAVYGQTNVIVMPGVADSSALQVYIENQTQLVRERLKLEERANDTSTIQAAGRTERLNDLVGFWQQGLMTDEQFHEEKKKMVD
jgi:hypothetical protein